MYFRVVSSVLGVCMLLLQATAHANSQGRDEQRHPHGPPPEAIEACNGKKAGDAVTVKNREGRSMKAICRLIAVPEHAPAPQ